MHDISNNTNIVICK